MSRTVTDEAPALQLGRIRWARLLVAENGWRWTAYAGLLGGLKKASRLLQGRMAQLESRHQLGGRNSVAVNYKYWQHWDWSRHGEEWTPSEEWKQSLITDVMLQHMKPGTTILEIGPGAGRWTEALQPVAAHLIVVDLSDRCIELCRSRFANASNIEFHVNDGRSLPAVATGSIDGIWSFDVFVHVAAADISAYLAEISRVLRPDAHAVIHHARAGREDDAADLGQRSNMTAELFAQMAQDEGLRVLEQFDSWGPDGRFKLSANWDAVTVLTK
jgi:cyclopropane fatty-acyl-phospholipid synthase-like methyltransferase